MQTIDLETWYDEYRSLIEGAYLDREEPWKGSGFSGPAERWERLRRPIAGCVEHSGAFLDIGCANGYLLQCLVGWGGEQGVRVDPYGIDISPKLVDLARKRLPEYAANINVGNGLDWIPPRRFEYVRAELCYVPEDHHRVFVARIIDEVLSEDGAFLVAEYCSRNRPAPEVRVDQRLRGLGFTVDAVHGALDYDGTEATRIAVLRRTA